MLNREQRKVLAVLNKMHTARQPFSEVNFFNQTRIFDRWKMLKLCQQLKKSGYLDSLSVNINNEFSLIDLSYKGMRYKQEHRAEILRYIADKWIDFLALIASIAALVISVIALLSTPPR